MGRYFSVAIVNFTSVNAACTCGVPECSILGPVLFSLYLLPLAMIFQISYHLYADDIQLYLPMKPDDNIYLQSLVDCVSKVKTWMVEFFFTAK